MAHKYDLRIMQYAADISMKSDMNFKHGCVILDKKGKIISTAYNKRITTKSKKILIYSRDNKLSRHAEEIALRNVDKRKLSGAKLYIVRSGECINSNYILMDSKPCNKCTKVIEKYMNNFGLKVVYYS
jgi:deoxycytidylate deaminase